MGLKYLERSRDKNNLINFLLVNIFFNEFIKNLYVSKIIGFLSSNQHSLDNYLKINWNSHRRGVKAATVILDSNQNWNYYYIWKCIAVEFEFFQHFILEVSLLFYVFIFKIVPLWFFEWEEKNKMKTAKFLAEKYCFVCVHEI